MSSFLFPSIQPEPSRESDGWLPVESQFENLGPAKHFGRGPMGESVISVMHHRVLEGIKFVGCRVYMCVQFSRFIFLYSVYCKRFILVHEVNFRSIRTAHYVWLMTF